jgi:hypothetical protein
MPDRGLFAPFSPNEEVTLRRVALVLRLKPAGRECYLALPKSAALHQSETPDEFNSKLADFTTKARLAKGWLSMTDPYVLYYPPTRVTLFSSSRFLPMGR